jgi:hypothetical protein
MEAIADKQKITFEIVRLKASVEQWEWDRRNADRDRYYASVSKLAGAGLLAAGLFVVLLSYTVMGIYMCVVGVGIALISFVKEAGARDRLSNLDGQLAYGKRRLVELDTLLERPSQQAAETPVDS